MARKKTTEGGETDLIDRNHGGGMETGDLIERESPGHDIGQAETESGHGPIVGTDYSANPEYVAAQEATGGGVVTGVNMFSDGRAPEVEVIDVPTGTAEQRLATKQANFSRLASKRVTGVLERLAVLKNLANTSTYEWTQEQHDKIFKTVYEHLAAVQNAFDAAKKAKVRDKSQLRFEV
jgi:hypothetical protein